MRLPAPQLAQDARAHAQLDHRLGQRGRNGLGHAASPSGHSRRRAPAPCTRRSPRSPCAAARAASCGRWPAGRTWPRAGSPSHPPRRRRAPTPGPRRPAGCPASWSCAARWVRSAPEHTASTTSLIVDPKRSLSERTSRQVEHGEGDRPAGADRRLEDGGCAERDGDRAGVVVERAAGEAHRGAADLARRAQRPHGLLMTLGSASVTSRACEGRRGGEPGRAGLGHRAALGREVEQLRQQLRAGHPVDHGVVHLGDEADHARRPAPRPRASPTAAAPGWSGRPMTSATIAVNSPSPPGSGSAARCRWLPRSKSGSSTQRGWSRPSGTGMRRRRKGVSVGHPVGEHGATRSKL